MERESFGGGSKGKGNEWWMRRNPLVASSSHLLALLSMIHPSHPASLMPVIYIYIFLIEAIIGTRSKYSNISTLATYKDVEGCGICFFFLLSISLPFSKRDDERGRVYSGLLYKMHLRGPFFKSRLEELMGASGRGHFIPPFFSLTTTQHEGG